MHKMLQSNRRTFHKYVIKATIIYGQTETCVAKYAKGQSSEVSFSFNRTTKLARRVTYVLSKAYKDPLAEYIVLYCCGSVGK